ncbi:BarA-associated response regulator UvrY (= GacA = SirA) [hydrothermal vent metagenome]|uniref:BarA-associated response regulator UvrY (= GacA = SirA) n=1 Tax=hydrothermal vent metagenome TaxID=652676 RepID=A0A3B0ZWF8_9ZZZZ
MLNISICGEHVLSVETIARLLQDEPTFNVSTIKSHTQLTCSNIKQDVLICCAISYSNTLFNEIKKLHQQTPLVKKILIMPMAHKQFLLKLLNAGVSAIVSYKSPPEELVQSIHLAMRRQQYLSIDLSKMVINTEYPSSFNTLSKRELEITYMLANGMNIKSVSSELSISPKTVNTYRYRIFNKLAIERNVDLFRMVSEEAAYMLA